MIASYSESTMTCTAPSLPPCIAASHCFCITATPEKTKPKKQQTPLQQKLLRQKWDASRRQK